MKERREPGTVVVIGVGNPFRGDDAAGFEVIRRLRAQGCPGPARLFEERGACADLMELWADAERVVLTDAVHSGRPAGTIHRFSVPDEPLPSRFFHYSTHGFGVAEAVELARVLNRLPPVLLVYGIEGEQFEAGRNLTPSVAAAAARVAEEIRADIRWFAPERPSAESNPA
jgi:hydrogenase maturation protease